MPVLVYESPVILTVSIYSVELTPEAELPLIHFKRQLDHPEGSAKSWDHQNAQGRSGAAGSSERLPAPVENPSSEEANILDWQVEPISNEEATLLCTFLPVGLLRRPEWLSVASRLASVNAAHTVTELHWIKGWYLQIYRWIGKCTMHSLLLLAFYLSHSRSLCHPPVNSARRSVCPKKRWMCSSYDLKCLILK